MWNYEKRLEYPINIKETNPQIAKFIMSQYGGPDGEISASLRYLSQRYAMPYREVMGVLTDIGREASEMFHLRGLRFFRTICGDASSGCFPITSLAVYPADSSRFLQPCNSI